MASATPGPQEHRHGLRKHVLFVALASLGVICGASSSLASAQDVPGAAGVRAERAERLVRRGQALARGGNRASALGSFREAVQIDPRTVDAYIGLARLYREAGRYGDAHEAILVGLHRRSRSVPLRLELAIHQKEVGELSAALTTLRGVVSHAPNHVGALRLHLALAQELGAWTEALRSARRLLDVSVPGARAREELALRVRALSILAQPLDGACIVDELNAESAILQNLCR
ncbi:MAG: Tfp pilus assembly protein PilF [Polyangiales bacterium]|jgi:Tfp pilus assembly protein PilF